MNDINISDLSGMLSWRPPNKMFLFLCRKFIATN